MRSPYFACAGDISPLSRHVATPPNAVREAAKPSEKIYSFLLKDLAEASANNYNYGQAIAGPPAKWVNGKSSCWEEKSIHEATRIGSRIKDRRWKIASVALKGPSIFDPPCSIISGRLRGRIINQFTVKWSNFMTTEEMIASLNTIIDNQKVIKENQEIIKANQEKLDALLASQATIQTNQSNILANQNEIISMLTR